MERMASAIANNRTLDLWKEIKKIKCRNNVTSDSVDGASNDSDISRTFSEKYKYLYNSVHYNINRIE